jgi:hypothetical protein
MLYATRTARRTEFFCVERERDRQTDRSNGVWWCVVRGSTFISLRLETENVNCPKVSMALPARPSGKASLETWHSFGK